MRRLLPLAALLAAVVSCGPDGHVDPAHFTASLSLTEALQRASDETGVPRDLLAAVAWSESRFTTAPAEAHEDHVHMAPEVGPLHLRSASGGGVDTLARATALLGVPEQALAQNPSLAVAGAAAVLAALGRETDARREDLGSWAEAVARYSALEDRPLQVAYASQVMRALRDGARARAWTGELVEVAAHRALPHVSELLTGANVAAQFSADYGPALWSAASSSNFTSGRGGNTVQFIVIHTMQGSYAGSISWFRNPAAMASAHYNIRSSDGQITQMVANGDTAWHGGNWYYNQRSIGIEHEGYVADPGRWYTDAMYASSARLVRALCDRYRVPIDRQHIIGHYQIPRSGSGAPCATGATNCGGAGGHTDPGNGGTGWNWDRFLALVRGNGTVTPPTPAYAATLVNMSCPATAQSGDRPVAWVEYRNTGTATWDNRNTRLGTTGPRDHRGVFFDMVNWVATNRPSAVDAATAPNAVGRFSFVLGIPEVTSPMTVSETYGLLQEGVTWFGPADDAVRCSVRVTPRPTPDAGTPAPRDAGPPAPRDAGTPSPDVAVETPDVVVETPDVVVETPDVVVETPDVVAVAADAGSTSDDADEDADGGTMAPVTGSCGCRATGRTAGSPALLLGLSALLAGRRRRFSRRG
ncbi:MAG: N-acetylmuramoyl-L-alanine amidase [Polyangiales bacterium]